MNYTVLTSIRRDSTHWTVQVERVCGRTFWVDVYIYEPKNTVVADWAQTVFFLEDEEDQIRKQIQYSVNEYDDATGTAVEYLRSTNEITQDEAGNWFCA